MPVRSMSSDPDWKSVMTSRSPAPTALFVERIEVEHVTIGTARQRVAAEAAREHVAAAAAAERIGAGIAGKDVSANAEPTTFSMLIRTSGL